MAATAPPAQTGPDSFSSLSIPLTSILSTKFEQPYFGQNFLVIEIKPSPEGGLTHGTKAELRFKDKAMFEFVSVLEKTRERFIYMRRQSADEEEGLRASLASHFPLTLPSDHSRAVAGYSTPSGGAAGPSIPLPAPDDAPPGYDAPHYEP